MTICDDNDERDCSQHDHLTAQTDDTVSVASSSSSSSSSVLSVSQQQQQHQKQQQHQTHRNRNSGVSILKVSSCKPRKSVSFHDDVHVRNHIHVTEYTDDERHDAFFQNFEYNSIFKNNSKIIRRMKILNKKKKKEKKTAEKKKKKKQKKTNSKKNHDCEMFHYLHHKKEKHEQQVDGDDEDRIEEECCEHHGYSIRGLEKETTSKGRKRRDQIYFDAKCLVATVQEELNAQIQTMQQEQYDINTTNSNKDTTLTTKFRFAVMAQETHHEYATMIAQRYNGICQHHTIEARDRGKRDASIAQLIHADDQLVQRHQRQQSTTSSGTAATTASSKSIDFDLADDDNNDDGNNSSSAAVIERVGSSSSSKFQHRMKLAKKFLRFRRISSSSSTKNKKNANIHKMIATTA